MTLVINWVIWSWKVPYSPLVLTFKHATRFVFLIDKGREQEKSPVALVVGSVDGIEQRDWITKVDNSMCVKSVL